MPDLISLQATPLATARQVAFQLRRDTSGILAKRPAGRQKQFPFLINKTFFRS